MQKGKTRCSIKPHAYCFIFHLHPSQCFSLHKPSVCLPSAPAPFFSSSSLSPCHSSSLLPLCCLLSNWYERATLGPSGVKWYKVIGRSSLLTGWPLKGLLEGANQVLLLPPLRRIPFPSSSAACVTWPGWGVRGRMINDAFSTCLEWSCPHRTVITHSQAAAAQRNCFLFVDLVYWRERWLWLGKMVLCTVHRGEDVCISNILVAERYNSVNKKMCITGVWTRHKGASAANPRLKTKWKCILICVSIETEQHWDMQPFCKRSETAADLLCKFTA